MPRDRVLAMSIFLKIERFGSDAKLIQIRSLYATVGEDAQGIFTCEAPKSPFFCLYAVGDRTICKAEVEGVTREEESLPVGSQWYLASGDVLQIGDYTLTAFLTSSSAEVLAGAEGLPIETIESFERELPSTPELVYHLASLQKRFPIFPGLKLRVGTSPEAEVVVDMPQVAALHAFIENQNGTVVVSPADGAVSVDGSPRTAPCVCEDNSMIELSPSGLELRVLYRTSP